MHALRYGSQSMDQAHGTTLALAHGTPKALYTLSQINTRGPPSKSYLPA